MTRPTAATPARRTARRAFSFVEVLFAVMILGIGFILIAGVFPAAMSQTALTQQETIAANVGPGAAAAVAALTADTKFTENLATGLLADGKVHPLAAEQVTKLTGGLILPEEPRFAFVPLLLRKAPVPATAKPPTVALLFIAVVQVRDGRAAFDQRDLITVTPSPVSPDTSFGTLTPHFAKVILKDGRLTGDPDTCEFSGGGVGAGAAAPGALVVVREGDDDSGRPAAGRIYRLGNLAAGSTTKYELLPGNDMSALPGPDGTLGTGDDVYEDVSSAREAWVIGQAPTQDSIKAGLSANFSGGSMVVGVYSTFISLR